MIVLFTDFGLHGPYVGQMRAVLHQMAPGIPVIDLFADAPVGNPRASAYLLAAYAAWFPAGTIFLCVVDPGVGGARPAIILEADGKRYGRRQGCDLRDSGCHRIRQPCVGDHGMYREVRSLGPGDDL